MSENVTLTDAERLILMNQYAILEFLSRAHPDVATQGNHILHDPDQYRWYQSLLERGYEVLLSEITQNVWPVRLTRQEQLDILDILDMYRHLQGSFDRLQDKGTLSEKDVLFEGWDGNSEKGELSFAEAFCFRGEGGHLTVENRKPDRYDMIKPSPAYNSHWPTTGAYYRMLEVYRPIRNAKVHAGWSPMNLEEITAVLAARVHPDHR